MYNGGFFSMCVGVSVLDKNETWDKLYCRISYKGWKIRICHIRQRSPVSPALTDHFNNIWSRAQICNYNFKVRRCPYDDRLHSLPNHPCCAVTSQALRGMRRSAVTWRNCKTREICSCLKQWRYCSLRGNNALLHICSQNGCSISDFDS